MESLRILNLAIALTGIALCSFGILQMLLSKKIYGGIERFFLPSYLFLTLFAASNLAGQLMRGRPGGLCRAGLYVSNFLEFFASYPAICFVSQYLLSLVDPQKKRKGARTALLLLFLAHSALLIASQFTGLYYVIDADNVYRRSAWFPLSQVFAALMLLLDSFLLLRGRKALSRKETAAFCVYFILPLFTLGLQAFVYGVYFNVAAMIVAVLTMHTFLVTDYTERYYRQREENGRLKVEIMLSQIKPHFLYNTLGAIEELCGESPRAAEALRKFARFLRGNMDSLSQAEMIPFDRELEHTRLFLELEKMRFGDDLTIAYDISCTAFRVPTLTLQPIVENAVSHGVRKNARGRGTVTIRTREYGDRYEVSVLDDGPGFEQGRLPDDARSHVGIANVRERLQTVGGSLRIESERGAAVTIILPKEETLRADICD